MKLVKLALAAAILGATQTAQAVSFSIDSNGAGAQSIPVAGPNFTSYYDQMQINYYSSTTFTDNQTLGNAGHGVLSTGDTFVGTGGLLNSLAGPGNPGTSAYNDNQVGGFLPNLTPPGPNNDNYGNNWGLSFGWNNLAGTVINDLGGTQYTGGTINVYYFTQADLLSANFGTQAGATTVGLGDLVMQLEVLNGGNNAIGQSLNLNGKITFAKDGFIDFLGFGDLNDLIALNINTTWENDQNTQPFFVNGVQGTTPADLANIFGGGTLATGVLAGQHNGSIEFDVPEPMSLSLLGIGLLGMGAVRRRSA